MMNPEPDDRLGQVLLAYEEAIQSGQAPSRSSVIRENPELATDLKQYFSSRDRIRRLTAPLRALAQSERSGQRPRPAALSPAELGQLGDFKLCREIGRGGMGIVYEAEQISLQRRVALKVLPFAAAVDNTQLQRFQNEARAAAQLHHPNIVAVFAVGSERGVHYYAMQLIEGQSLAALLEELRRLERRPEDFPAHSASAMAVGISGERSRGGSPYIKRIAQLGIQAASAIHYAHQLGVVHRDIKPANLLLDAQGDVWVTDFGLAQLQNHGGITRTGELVGTLRYMSPEQALGFRGLIDHRADIYSLGVTLYELLTLKPVFDGRDRQELLHQVAYQEPLPVRTFAPTVPAELETIVLKAMAKDPADRYATAAELAEDLQCFLDCRPIKARRPNLLERGVKWCRRHKTIMASAGVVVLLALLGTATSTFLIARQHGQTKAAYAREQQRAREANEERARAEEGFLQARRALDFITELSEAELAQKPGMQQLRKKLLAASLAYYQRFIDQHRNTPSWRKQLGLSHWRLAKISNELGNKVQALAELERAMEMEEKLHQEAPDDHKSAVRLAFIRYRLFELEGCGLLGLLTHRSVREELRLTDEQVEQLTTLEAELVSQRRQLLRPAVSLARADLESHFEEFAEKNAAVVCQVLDDRQEQRLDQIVLQLKCPSVFGEPRVAEGLGLTKEQRKEIGETLAETRGALWDHVYPVESGKRDRKRPEEIRRAALARLLKILTPEQRTGWHAMIGEPFDAHEPLIPKGDFIPR